MAVSCPQGSGGLEGAFAAGHQYGSSALGRRQKPIPATQSAVASCGTGKREEISGFKSTVLSFPLDPASCPACYLCVKSIAPGPPSPPPPGGARPGSRSVVGSSGLDMLNVPLFLVIDVLDVARGTGNLCVATSSLV